MRREENKKTRIRRNKKGETKKDNNTWNIRNKKRRRE